MLRWDLSNEVSEVGAGKVESDNGACMDGLEDTPRGIAAIGQTRGV